MILSPGTPAPFGPTVAPVWDSSVVPETAVELDDGMLLMGQHLRRYEGIVTGRGTVSEGSSSVSLVRVGTDSTGERRRLFLTSGTGTGCSAYAGVKTVIMVFGSQQGGGAAVLGTTDKARKRGNGAAASMEHSLSDPIVASNDHTIWIDGEEVADNTAARFNGGWQIVSVDVSGLSLYGIGLPGDSGTHTDSGGQNYDGGVEGADPARLRSSGVLV